MTDKLDVIDITDFLPAHDTRLQIMTPDGKPTGWWWTLAPTSHDKAVAFQNQQAHDALALSKAVREAQFNGQRYEAEEKTPDQERRRNVKWIVARTLDWTPIKISGQTFTFSDKATEDLLIRPEMLFAQVQIVKALNDDARFMKRSVEA